MKSVSTTNNLPRFVLSLLCSFLLAGCGWSWNSFQHIGSHRAVWTSSNSASLPSAISQRKFSYQYSKLLVVLNNFDDKYSMEESPGEFWDNLDDKDPQGGGPGQQESSNNRISDEELEASLTDWDDKIARFNTVHLVGRIGSHPEPKYFDDGKVVVNLSLACRRKYHYLERKERGIQSGEEETDWYGLEIWGQTAEYVSNFVDKGARVGVVGSLQVDKWTDKATGEPRQKAKVVVREFDILETKAESEMRRNKGGGAGRETSFYAGGSGTGKDRFDEYNPSMGSSGGFFDS